MEPVRPHLWLRAPDWMALPPLDGNALNRFETSVARTLPPTYLRLLMEQNGGPLRYDAFPWSCKHFPDGFVPVPNLRGIGPAAGILTPRQLPDMHFLPQHCLVICADEEHVVALNYEQSAIEPSVWLYAAAVSGELSPDIETFIQRLTRAMPDFLFAVDTSDDLDDDEVPEVFEEILATATDDFEMEQWDDTHSLLFVHGTWRSRRDDGPATVLLRPVADDGDDREFPEYPHVRWAVEADMGTRNAAWLHRLCDGHLKLLRVHIPVGATETL